MDEINDILMDGEKLLWSGRPRRAPRNAIWYAAFFCALILLIASPVVYAAASSDMSIFEHVTVTVYGKRLTPSDTPASVYSALMTILGTGLVLIFVLAVWFAGVMRQSYALTNQRALIIGKLFQVKITSISLKSISTVERTGGDQFGTIKFFPSNPDFLARVASIYQIPANTFFQIERAQEVEKLALKAIADSGERNHA